jgi:general secretion pathway protein N
VRRTALAIAGVAVFAYQVAGLAQPRSSAVSFAAIETESAEPDLNGEASTDARHPAPELSTTGNPLWAIPISKLSATRDRPLFSASRRPRTPTGAAAPAPTPTMAAQPPAPEMPPFKLVGTIIGENSRIAIFFNEALKAAAGVKEGESDSGWILRSVDPRSAILDGSGRTVTLDLLEPAAQESPAQQSPASRFNPESHLRVHKR